MGRAARRHARAAARGNPPGGNQSRRRSPLSRQPGCALNSAAHARGSRLSGLKSRQIAKLVKPSAAARRIAPDEHRYQIRNFINLKKEITMPSKRASSIKSNDAISMLKEDHDKVKKMFKDF